VIPSGLTGSLVRKKASSILSSRTSYQILSQTSHTPESEPHFLPNSFDHGINTFDTANVYSNGESERILGKALKVHNIPREDVVIMTKLHAPVFREKSTTPMNMGTGSKLDEAGYVNRHGLSRKAGRLARRVK